MMLPMEALSSSTEGAPRTRSDGSGFILILNFFLWSSSSSDSSEEKKGDFLLTGRSAALTKDLLLRVQDLDSTMTYIISSVNSDCVSATKRNNLFCQLI